MISFSFSIEEINAVAKKIRLAAAEEKVWIFQGQMGAGKTTLIKAIAYDFGVIDQVSSPTFGLVNHYNNEKGSTFYHFDFYRLEKPEEALDIGIEEYFYSNHVCWIEWAEKVYPYLPDEYFLISLEATGKTQRKVTLEHI